MLSLLSTTTHINLHLLTKLFDSMIQPIAIYGSEVWASKYLFKIAQSKDRVKALKQLDKLPFEKVHNRFCKRILGVYTSTSNVLRRAEIGRQSTNNKILDLFDKAP